MLSDGLLDILVCPKSKEPLVYFPRGEDNSDASRGFLLCLQSRLRYRIEDGVPVMLVEEASELSAAEVETLVDRAKQLGILRR